MSLRYAFGKVCVTLMGCVALAAAPQAGDPTFEAASLKPSAPNGLGGGFQLTLRPGGRLHGVNVSLRQFILIAWDLNTRDQIVGLPSQLESQTYDLEAAAGHPIGEPEGRIMLRRLVEERFSLRVHRETRESTVYLLLPGKSGVQEGPNLRKAPSGDCGAMTTPDKIPPPSDSKETASPCNGVTANPGRLTGHRASMTDIAKGLSMLARHSVINRTGITSSFDITLEWTPDPDDSDNGPSGPGASGPSLFTALEEQLGLKLESGKGPIDVIVVDSVQKPTEN